MHIEMMLDATAAGRIIGSSGNCTKRHNCDRVGKKGIERYVGMMWGSARCKSSFAMEVLRINEVSAAVNLKTVDVDEQRSQTRHEQFLHRAAMESPLQAHLP